MSEINTLVEARVQLLEVIRMHLPSVAKLGSTSLVVLWYCWPCKYVMLNRCMCLAPGCSASL